MNYRKIIISLFLLLSITAIGVIGYILTEDLHFFDALWLAIVSFLTIGYGDIAPTTTSGKILTLILIPIAIAITTYMLAEFAGAIIGGKLSNEMRKRKMNKKIEALQNHVIICGYGRVGQQVYYQLQKDNQVAVVIDSNKDVIENMPVGMLYVEGNATEDEVLHHAGIARARGVVVTLPNDADNVFITLTVKGINPNIHTVARAEKDFTEEKLYRAGADKVINTSNIGGKRMAMAITKPISVEYVDTILHDQNIDYNIEEFIIRSTSPLVNKSLLESRIREEYGVNIVAIKRGHEMISNLQSNEKLIENDLLIVFGSSDQLKCFEKVAM